MEEAFSSSVQTPEQEAVKYKQNGSKFFLAGKYQAAYDAYSQAIVRNGNDADAWSSRALVQLRMERWSEALKDADNALARDLRSAESHCRRALALYQLHLYDDSLKAFDRGGAVQQGLSGTARSAAGCFGVGASQSGHTATHY